MKLFLLRHEKRWLGDPTFYSPLLPDGLKDANKLIEHLMPLNIDKIYSSPFKRVLQTIKPYCDKMDMKVNIEYSLYEQTFDSDKHIIKFDEKDFKKDLLPGDDEYYLKNEKYSSFMPLNQIKWSKDTSIRSINFVNYLIENNKNSDNILIATHAGIIRDILKETKYAPMGGLIEFDYKNNLWRAINF